MPVTSTGVTVTGTRVKISDSKVPTSQANRYYDPSVVAKFVYVQDGDFDGDTLTYVGGSAVATTNGVLLSKTNVTVFQLHQTDELWAVSSGTGSVRVVEVG